MKKNILAFMSVLLTVCIFFSITVSADTTENTYTFIVPGDVDCNKFLEIKDVTLFQKHLANMTVIDEAGLSVADYNGDGNSNILDATEMQKCLVGIDYDCIIKPEECISMKYTPAPPEGIVHSNNHIDFNYTLCGRNIFFDPGADDHIVKEYTSYTIDGHGNRKFNEPVIITTKEQFFSYMQFYSPQFDDDFFSENALIAWIEYRGISLGDKLFHSVYVRDDTLYLRVNDYTTSRIGKLNYYYMIIRMNKNDIADVNNFLYSVECYGDP